MTHADLQRRFERMLDASRDTGDGGREVLETAYHVLSGGRELDRWPDVGLEDLWAHALKEGRSLFPNPNARWGRTGPRETKDMIGQTTIGPWQITIDNVRRDYGLPYGIHNDWPQRRVFEFCEQRPRVQAGMICDYIQRSYSTLGVRSPYAIQRYFWLEAFAKREIGQGAWDKSVLPVPPDGDWRKLTPEMKADTGFYAKQILLGTPSNPRGLVHWLWITGDTDAIHQTLATWSTQRDGTWNAQTNTLDLAESTGTFTVRSDDLHYIPDPACRAFVTDALSGR